MSAVIGYYVEEIETGNVLCDDKYDDRTWFGSKSDPFAVEFRDRANAQKYLTPKRRLVAIHEESLRLQSDEIKRLKELLDRVEQHRIGLARANAMIDAERIELRDQLQWMRGKVKATKEQFRAITSDFPGLTGPLVDLFKDENG